jgi:hypothetical protein
MRRSQFCSPRTLDTQASEAVLRAERAKRTEHGFVCHYVAISETVVCSLLLIVVGAFELQHDITSVSALEPFVGDRGAGDVAAQAFEFHALMGATAHPGMQAEAVRIGAQGRRGFFVPAGHGAQAQKDLYFPELHNLPGS